VHDPEQSRHLLINTLASQVTLFPLAGVRYATVCSAPSLTDWARQQGYRRYDDGGYAMHGDSGHAAGSSISDGDYLPRGLLGAYLCWAYAQLAAACRVRDPATAPCQRLRSGLQADGQWAITLDSGAWCTAASCFSPRDTTASSPTPSRNNWKASCASTAHAIRSWRWCANCIPTQLQQIAAGTGGHTGAGLVRPRCAGRADAGARRPLSAASHQPWGGLALSAVRRRTTFDAVLAQCLPQRRAA
jgi:hypothetical protein